MTREQDIQREILAYLKAVRVHAWRSWVGGMLVKGGIRVKNDMKGFPDISGLLPGGRAFFVEVKRPGNVLSEDQLEWKRELEASGALYVVATSVEAVRQALQRVTQEAG